MGRIIERQPIVGTAPFFSIRRSELTDFRVDGIQLTLTLPMAALTDPSAINIAVLRQVLHRPVAVADEEGPIPGDTPSLAAEQDATMRRIVADVVGVSPLSDTLRQVAGKPMFTIAVVVTVRTALLHAHGMQLGVAMDSPYEETFRVRLVQRSLDNGSSSRAVDGASYDDATAGGSEAPDAPIVLCRCLGDEPVASGTCLFVGVEPNLIKCLAIRPPRTSPGSWARVTDTHKVEMMFEFDADKQKGKAAEQQQVVVDVVERQANEGVRSKRKRDD